MTHPRYRILLCLAVAAVAAPRFAAAQNLLTYGDFETPAVAEVPFWTLEEVVSGTTTQRNAAALAGFADNPIDPLNPDPNHRGLWFQAFNGDPDPGFVDARLTQVAPATPGENYVFSGTAAFETNYSGGVATLDPASPWGAIESPTETEFELAFLDAGGTVIGTPLVRDVASEVFPGFGYTAVTPLSAVAPEGAASVRVQARALQMADAGLNPQSAFVDNFSLTTSSAPSTELLANANLNELPPSIEDFLLEEFELIETPDTADSISIATFANNPDTGGANGIWVRPFVADAESAVVQQTVDAMAGEEYMFSASARWEVNYLGDGLTGGENETLIELAFLDDMGAVLDSVSLDLRADGKTAAANSWTTHSVTGVAPAGTVQARVGGIVNNITANTENTGNQSAFWDDFLLTLVGDLPGDYNNDGQVDAADYTVWRDGDSPDSSQAGYDLWAQNYGAGTGGASAVPEPTAAVLALVALLAAGVRRQS
ncbi:hypothetical protein [Botrimarina sp.]|uniref:hypothetical protein n=1 Tax=Botrimarina sp. TaxID=2795802 RepID=UPI0032EAD7D1